MLVVKEMNYNGREITNMRSYTDFKTGKLSAKYEFRDAFIMDRKFKASVIDFKPIHEGLCVLPMTVKLVNIWLVNIYASTEDIYDEIKEEFYHSLERLYDSLLPNDAKILLGGFNANIGN